MLVLCATGNIVKKYQGATIKLKIKNLVKNWRDYFYESNLHFSREIIVFVTLWMPSFRSHSVAYSFITVITTGFSPEYNRSWVNRNDLVSTILWHHVYCRLISAFPGENKSWHSCNVCSGTCMLILLTEECGIHSVHL